MIWEYCNKHDVFAVILNIKFRAPTVPLWIVLQHFIPLGHHSRVPRLCRLFFLHSGGELCAAVGAELRADGVLLTAGRADRALRDGFLRQLRAAVGAKLLVCGGGLAAIRAYLHVLCRFGSVALQRTLQVAQRPFQTACRLCGLLYLLGGGLRRRVDLLGGLVRKLGSFRLNSLLDRLAYGVSHALTHTAPDGSF